MAEKTTMTHNDLVAYAVRWLRRRCQVVISRRNIMTNEQPDAIGWTADGRSWLIECKASLADFQRDKHKPCRRFPQLGMGNIRYYLAPVGLLTAKEIPPNWGLLVVRNGRVYSEAEPVWYSGKSLSAENQILLHHIRKMEAQS